MKQSHIYFKNKYNELHRFLRSRLGCAQTATELTHETFLRVERYLQEQTVDNVNGLMFRVAANLAIDHQRRNNYRQRFEVSAEENPLLNIACELSDPEQAVADQQRLMKIGELLTQLPPICQAVFILNTVEGCTHQEIASRLNISTSTVAKHMARALLFCEEHLSQV